MKTVYGHARRKGRRWVTIRLSHDRVDAEDGGRWEQPGARIDRIRWEIGLEGPLDDEQRARVTEIAGKCPVHRTLVGELRITDVAAVDTEADGDGANIAERAPGTPTGFAADVSHGPPVR